MPNDPVTETTFWSVIGFVVAAIGALVAALGSLWTHVRTLPRPKDIEDMSDEIHDLRKKAHKHSGLIQMILIKLHLTDFSKDQE